jgi:parvulin-like peptidyl-prolyl isomerase
MSAPHVDEIAAESSRPLWWLLAGAVAGVALAAQGLLSSAGPGGELPEHGVARVNGTLIFSDEFERLVAGLESDTREVAPPETRRRVLDRMIDEELLVQRGLELGLAESDRRVRADITAAMIRSVVVEAEDDPPQEDELRDFYREESSFFTQPGRLRVRQIFFRVPTREAQEAAAARASEARRRLDAGETFEAVAAELGEEPISKVPDALLPPAKVREYLGPTALRATMELEPGQVSAPVRSGTGFHLIQLVQSEPPRVPDFEDVAQQVRAEYLRRRGDRALRDYLDELRKRAEVSVAPELQ